MKNISILLIFTFILISCVSEKSNFRALSTTSYKNVISSTDYLKTKKGYCLEGLLSLVDRRGYEEISKIYETVLFERKWHQLQDDELDFLRFIRRATYEKNKGLSHGKEIYGFENYKAFKEADDYLNEIPIGKLKLSIELFSKVHEKSSAGITPILKTLKSFLPDGFVPSRAGVLKRRGSVGRDPAIYPLNEEQYNAIMNNPWLGDKKFIELPWPISRKGKRRGFIQYATVDQTEDKLKSLISWYEKNKDKKDPIELAAIFQRAFISIHPFIDGNGRTSRLLMDRILREFNLPPALLRESNDDLYVSESKWINKVREGVKDYVSIHQKGEYSKGSVNRPSFDKAHRYLYDDKFSEVVKKYKISDVKINKNDIYQIGGREFILNGNGFFYSSKGIPYAYREGKMYPIADATYPIYFKGDIFYTNPDAEWERKIAPQHKRIYIENFKLVKKINANKKFADNIIIEPYLKIKEANEKLVPYYWNWQKYDLELALKKIDDLEDNLHNTSLMKTFTSKKLYVDSTIARYQFLDNELYNLSLGLERTDPLQAKVFSARERLFDAAKFKVDQLNNDLRNLPRAVQDAVKNNIKYREIKFYVDNTFLKYSSFKSAYDAIGDKYITLLRSDSALVKYIGFLSHKGYNAIFEKIPGYKSIRKEIDFLLKDEENRQKSKLLNYIKGLVKKFDNKKSTPSSNEDDYDLVPLLRLLQKIFYSNYDNRGTSDELVRQYVELYLHQDGRFSKGGSSFSTNLSLYDIGLKKGSDSIAFADNSYMPSLFFLKIPRDKVSWNYASRYSTSEFEMVSSSWITPNYIIKKVNMDYDKWKKTYYDKLSKNSQKIFDNFMEKHLSVIYF